MTNFQFPMTNNKFKNQNAGFVLLFAVTLSSILLAVALGVASIAEKEIKFGTSIRETNDAFLAADTGIECAIFHDKSSATAFPLEGQETSINCASSNIPIIWNGIHNFAIEGLGSAGDSCAKVNVIKEELTELSVIKTTIISKGYNIGDVGCEDPGTDRIEREIQVSYLQDNPAPPATNLAPYGGTPISIPGKIEAEDYDTGGEGISYHDGDSVNSGGVYRSDGVDISNDGGEEHVGWWYAGEWTNYSINVITAGSYTLKAKVASPGTGGTFMIKLDGQDVTGIISIPNTGGWQTWQTVSKVVSLTEGPHIFTIEGTADGTTSYVGNIDNIDLTTFVPAPPAVDLTADATTINNGDSTTLRWETSGATSPCVASEAWSGNKVIPAGSQSTGALTSTSTFTLTCSNAYGSTADSVTITIAASSGSGTLFATPNPISVCPPATTGITTITGSSTVNYEVRVGDPISGGVLSGYNKPAEPYFSYTTGNWVVNPTTFYLVAVSDNSILATVTVTLSCSAPTYRASAQTGVASGNLTISKPAGVVTNDVMVASIAFRPNIATITPPSGWTLAGNILNNPNSIANSLATYYKIATSGEPASYTWTMGTITGAAGGITAFSGAAITTPIVQSGKNTAWGLFHDTPSVTTPVANTMIVTAHAFASSATWSPPSGMSKVVDVASLTTPNSGGISMVINYVLQSAAGTTGAKTATASDYGDVGNAQILILQPQ